LTIIKNVVNVASCWLYLEEYNYHLLTLDNTFWNIVLFRISYFFASIMNFKFCYNTCSEIDGR
jgi:hypothetical protein